MVNVRFKKNSISSYSVYFDVSEKNQKRYYVFLDLVVSKDYYPLFAVQLAKRKNMKISANDSQKINYIRLKLLEAQLQFAKGEPIEAKRKVIQKFDFCNALDEIASEKNHSTYVSAFKQYKAFCGNHTDVPTDSEMKKFESYLLEQELSKKSVNIYINRIIIAINDLHVKGRISTKLSLYKAPSVPKKEPCFLELQEIQSFYEAVLASEDNMEKSVGYSYLLSCFTSLRFSDVSILKWENIQKGAISFTAQKTKRKKGAQTYPLLTEAEKLLQEIREIDLSKDDKSIFPTIINNIANMYIRTLAEKAGIKKHLTFHSSRHSFGAMMIESTGNLYATSQFMGHSDTKTTEIYAHLTNKNMKSMAANTPILQRK